MRISWSGRAKSVSRCEACAETGVRARFLVGRFERGSADMGMDSGPVPDMVVVLAVWVDGGGAGGGAGGGGQCVVVS